MRRTFGRISGGGCVRLTYLPRFIPKNVFEPRITRIYTDTEEGMPEKLGRAGLPVVACPPSVSIRAIRGKTSLPLGFIRRFRAYSR
jgi:hypothetical protein